jgi:folate-binding protein YgfZ
MSMSAHTPLSEGPDALGVIAFRGPDAGRFLQGQLSADIGKLMPGSGMLAGLHNPQGRAIALVALACSGTEEILAALPSELLEPVLQRLRKYVLRAKVRIEDVSATMRVMGADAGALEPGTPQVRWGERRLLFMPAEAARPEHRASREQWELADVREGLPQVYATTSEQFVAQMLNLDLLGAIAFDKGCYTGQEVIARAHYRGRVKRRMQRWLNPHGVLLKAGDAAHSENGRVLAVVRVAASEAGQEVLAVGNFTPATEEAPAAREGIELSGPLPLPYTLPE